MIPASTLSTALLATGPSEWSVEKSTELYRIGRWGDPYFSINSSGNISVRLQISNEEEPQEIDLLAVVKEATSRSLEGAGLQLPLLVRLPDVLKNRLQSLYDAFVNAIYNRGYKSHYQGVFPVKSNQDQFIVENIVEFGSGFGFGLEAGSKPELLLAMSCLCKGSRDAYLVCNGFKDAEYVSLALTAQKLNFKAFIVLELEEELDLVLHLADKNGVENPLIGVRAKLRSKHNGHFGSTSGKKGKFGLTEPQIDRIVEQLRTRDKLNCLQLLHFHMGSQIPSKTTLAKGVSEGARIYCKLVQSGASMGVIDVGGGLGVDYDGSKSTDSNKFSVEYTLEEYADTVVVAVRDVCDTRGVDHPILCSESGRAIVSHHSVLVFEAYSASSPASENAVSSWNYLSSFYRWITKSSGVTAYHVNLSIFASIPDFWGIKHLFPILPIHRLDEVPNVRATLSDLTCDSDGVIAKFIGGKSSLMLHELKEGKGYYLGMFLGGAYQEALGGHHNLFGLPNAVRVTRDGLYGFGLEPIPGRSCEDVLRVMNHDPDAMKRTLSRRAQEFGHGELFDTRLRPSFDKMPYLVTLRDIHMNGNGDSAGPSSSNGLVLVNHRGENGFDDGRV